MTRGRFLRGIVTMVGAAAIAPDWLARLPAGDPSHGAHHASAGGGRSFPHPEPREGVTAEHVIGESELGRKRKVLASYAAARAHPELFDGLYCACRCRDSLQHRSLLGCFESRQPTGCMGCQEEAMLVDKMARDGKTLAEIRAAVDEEWG